MRVSASQTGAAVPGEIDADVSFKHTIKASPRWMKAALMLLIAIVAVNQVQLHRMSVQLTDAEAEIKDLKQFKLTVEAKVKVLSEYSLGGFFARGDGPFQYLTIANPVTGSASCPEGYVEQQFARVVGPGDSAGPKGMWLYMCTDKDAPNKVRPPYHGG